MQPSKAGDIVGAVMIPFVRCVPDSQEPVSSLSTSVDSVVFEPVGSAYMIACVEDVSPFGTVAP